MLQCISLDPSFWHNLSHCFTIQGHPMYQYKLHRQRPPHSHEHPLTHMDINSSHNTHYRLTSRPFLASSQVTVCFIMRCFVLLLDHDIMVIFNFFVYDNDLCWCSVVKIKKIAQLLRMRACVMKLKCIRSLV